LIKVVNNDTDEEIEGEKGAEYDEDHKVEVHVEVDFSDGLFLHLKPDSSMSQLVTGAYLWCRPWKYIDILTPLESTAACIISIHPLNVAYNTIRPGVIVKALHCIVNHWLHLIKTHVKGLPQRMWSHEFFTTEEKRAFLNRQRGNKQTNTHHLQEGEVAESHVVKVDLHLRPVELGVVHGEALWLVVDHGDTVDEAGSVHALPELAGEQVDPHDAEDEPEDEAHEQHVHDGGDGADERVHHHLAGSRSDTG